MSKLQLHKRFTKDQVKFILDKYLAQQIKAKNAIKKLDIGRTRFYQLVHQYQYDPLNFNINYQRQKSTRSIDPDVEKNILAELEIEKSKIIDNGTVAE